MLVANSSHFARKLQQDLNWAENVTSLNETFLFQPRDEQVVG